MADATLKTRTSDDLPEDRTDPPWPRAGNAPSRHDLNGESEVTDATRLPMRRRRPTTPLRQSPTPVTTRTRRSSSPMTSPTPTRRASAGDVRAENVTITPGRRQRGSRPTNVIDQPGRRGAGRAEQLIGQPGRRRPRPDREPDHSVTAAPRSRSWPTRPPSRRAATSSCSSPRSVERRRPASARLACRARIRRRFRRRRSALLRRR